MAETTEQTEVRRRTTTAVAETREQIKNMTGFTSEEEMAKAMPDVTAALEATAQPEKKKRGRPKGSSNNVNNDDPLAGDKRYQDAVGRMASFGASKTIESAFTATGAPLDEEEKQRVEDLSYVAAKQYNLDPTRSPIFMMIYTILLIAQLILVRVAGTTTNDIWKQFSGIFSKKEGEEETE